MLSLEYHLRRLRDLRLMRFDAEVCTDLVVLGSDIWQYAETLRYL